MAKVVVIGGGVAGLSAGIYSRLAGYDVTVLEKHFIAGGNLTGWVREGFRIDNCIHWLTGTNPKTKHYDMWVDLGALGNGVETVQPESLFTCERDGRTVSLYCSLSRLREEMLAVAPEDEREIKRLIGAIEFIMGLSGFAGESCDGGFSPRMLRAVPALKEYYGLTTGQLAKKFKNSTIRCFITGFWGEYFGALALLYVFATYCGKNGALPRGGSVDMARRMTERLKSLGGDLRTGCEVKSVNIENGRVESVTLSGGEVVVGDYFILTADPKSFFGTGLKLPLPKKLKKMYDNPKLKRFSAYQCAFAVDFDSVPFEGDIIFDVSADEAEILHTKQMILREFSHEPSYSPKGKSLIQTLTFIYEEDSLEFIRLYREDREGYEKKKRELSSLIESIILRKYPSLGGKIRLIDMWTPATYKRYVGSEIGSFMSFVMPESYTPICIDGRVDGVKNLVLATQWQQSPGGLPIAAECGMKAVKLIEKY